MYDLDHVFRYHPPTGLQQTQYEALREAAKHFASVVLAQTPMGADQDAAIRHIREALMTANASIALGGRVQHRPTSREAPNGWCHRCLAPLEGSGLCPNCDTQIAAGLVPGRMP